MPKRGFDKKEWATGRVRALKPRRAAEHPKESGRIRKNGVKDWQLQDRKPSSGHNKREKRQGGGHIMFHGRRGGVATPLFIQMPRLVTAPFSNLLISFDFFWFPLCFHSVVVQWGASLDYSQFLDFLGFQCAFNFKFGAKNSLTDFIHCLPGLLATETALSALKYSNILRGFFQRVFGILSNDRSTAASPASPASKTSHFPVSRSNFGPFGFHSNFCFVIDWFWPRIWTAGALTALN